MKLSLLPPVQGRYLFITVFFMVVQCPLHIYAQGGGPPMLTDDPGTPDKGHWEINTTIITNEITNSNVFELPLIDANYGYNERTQLKLEMPYLVSETGTKTYAGSAGEPLPGIKYRFLDEDKSGIAVSVYPQVALAIQKSDSTVGLLPVQFQKSFGKFTIGEEIGVVLIKHYLPGSINGNLLGFKFSEKFEVMGEWFNLGNVNGNKTAQSFLNFGFRCELNKKLILIASFGTQLETPQAEQRQYFISYTGLQWLL